MADHSKPTLTSNYSSEFIPELDGRFNDLALGLDPAHTTPTNLPQYSIRYSSISKRWELWSGTAWAEMETEYAINVSTATKLKTASKIALSGGATASGVDFDGSGDISLEVVALDYNKISNPPSLGTVAPRDVVSSPNDATDAHVVDVGWIKVHSVPLDGSKAMTSPLQIIYGGNTAKLESNGNVSGPIWDYGSGNDAKTYVTNQLAGKFDKSGGSVGANGIIANTTPTQPGILDVTADIGLGYADWTANGRAAVQQDAPNSAAAYMGMRWTRWGGRHIAAIMAYEGGTNSTPPQINFMLDGVAGPAWTFGRVGIDRGAGGSVWGTWNLANPASVGSQCSRDAGYYSTAQISIYNGGSVNVPAPYVVQGVTVGGGDRPWIILNYSATHNG